MWLQNFRRRTASICQSPIRSSTTGTKQTIYRTFQPCLCRRRFRDGRDIRATANPPSRSGFGDGPPLHLPSRRKSSYLFWLSRASRFKSDAMGHLSWSLTLVLLFTAMPFDPSCKTPAVIVPSLFSFLFAPPRVSQPVHVSPGPRSDLLGELINRWIVLSLDCFGIMTPQVIIRVLCPACFHLRFGLLYSAGSRGRRTPGPTLTPLAKFPMLRSRSCAVLIS